MVIWLKINGTQAPTPRTCKVGRYDLDSENTTRNEKGVLHRDRIRSGTYKCEYTWRLTTSELSDLTSLLSSETFTAEFYDLTTNTYHTCTMYAGDRTADTVLSRDSAGGVLVDYSCSLIEC
ncbi:DUF6711 family protein [Ruminococcus sp. Marseille-P6503]|uniref:DUF6711 family protein n=1 Tax=Ruminococcus sp. Marseille-P6503 TaxID=2364796 RepID=UPI000F51F4BF|nr:DUF6711 family protein [Ruminococcus sp. Marseille-P6503]